MVKEKKRVLMAIITVESHLTEVGISRKSQETEHFSLGPDCFAYIILYKTSCCNGKSHIPVRRKAIGPQKSWWISDWRKTAPWLASLQTFWQWLEVLIKILHQHQAGWGAWKWCKQSADSGQRCYNYFRSSKDLSSVHPLIKVHTLPLKHPSLQNFKKNQ